MRRVRRRCFQTRSELLRNRALLILVGYGTLPYSHESLHELIYSLNPLVIPHVLHNGGPWTRSSHAAQQQRKYKRYRRRDAVKASSTIQHALQSGTSLSYTPHQSLCVASTRNQLTRA
jgi:hypothetical protein